MFAKRYLQVFNLAEAMRREAAYGRGWLKNENTLLSKVN